MGAKYGDELIDAAGAARGAKRTPPGCKCFPAGTTVATADGDKSIEKIKVGDKVWARRLVTGRSELRRVTALFNRQADALMTITIDGDRVAVTPDHPFYVAGRGWVQSNNLKVGDKLEQRDGSVTTILDIRLDRARTTVYNSSVERDRNYYVGRAGLLVHNCDWPRPTASNCTQCAIKIQKMIGGERIAFRGPGTPFLGPSRHNPGGTGVTMRSWSKMVGYTMALQVRKVFLSISSSDSSSTQTRLILGFR